jgi:hypothetical protein
MFRDTYARRHLRSDRLWSARFRGLGVTEPPPPGQASGKRNCRGVRRRLTFQGMHAQTATPADEVRKRVDRLGTFEFMRGKRRLSTQASRGTK